MREEWEEKKMGVEEIGNDRLRERKKEREDELVNQLPFPD